MEKRTASCVIVCSQARKTNTHSFYLYYWSYSASCALKKFQERHKIWSGRSRVIQQIRAKKLGLKYGSAMWPWVSYWTSLWTKISVWKLGNLTHRILWILNECRYKVSKLCLVHKLYVSISHVGIESYSECGGWGE